MQTREKFIHALLLLAFICLVSCSISKRDDQVRLAHAADYILLPSAVFNDTRVMTQRVTLAYQGRQHIFLAQIELTPQGLVLVAMSELGQTLFSLQYTHNELHAETAGFVPQMFEPKYLLADLQLIYWPLSAWQQQMIGAPLSIFDEDSAEGRRRLIKRGAEIVIDIKYNDRDIIYHHLERAYRIHAEILP